MVQSVVGDLPDMAWNGAPDDPDPATDDPGPTPAGEHGAVPVTLSGASEPSVPRPLADIVTLPPARPPQAARPRPPEAGPVTPQWFIRTVDVGSGVSTDPAIRLDMRRARVRSTAAETADRWSRRRMVRVVVPALQVAVGPDGAPRFGDHVPPPPTPSPDPTAAAPTAAGPDGQGSPPLARSSFQGSHVRALPGGDLLRTDAEPGDHAVAVDVPPAAEPADSPPRRRHHLVLKTALAAVLVLGGTMASVGLLGNSSPGAAPAPPASSARQFSGSFNGSSESCPASPSRAPGVCSIPLHLSGVVKVQATWTGTGIVALKITDASGRDVTPQATGQNGAATLTTTTLPDGDYDLLVVDAGAPNQPVSFAVAVV